MYIPKRKTQNNKKAKSAPKFTPYEKTKLSQKTTRTSLKITRVKTHKLKAKVPVETEATVTDTTPVEIAIIEPENEAVEEAVEAVEETPSVEIIEEPSIETEESLDLQSMTKKQLIELAKTHKVTYKNLVKADLIEALEIVLN